MSIADKVYNSQFVAVTEVVLMEVATVISHKYSQREAVETIAVLKGSGYTILSVDNAVLKNTWDLFKIQKNKGTSVIDCSNVVLARQLGCQIVSFDHFYQQFSDVRLAL